MSILFLVVQTALGFRLARGQDQAVEAGFGDDGQLLLAARGAHNVSILFVVIQTARDVECIAEVQHLAHVSSDEAGLAIGNMGGHMSTPTNTLEVF